jgi:hypothetical protein
VRFEKMGAGQFRNPKGGLSEEGERILI